MEIVGVTINIQNEAVLLACKNDVDYEGVKEVYADNGEGALDTFLGFENNALEPFEWIGDEELIDLLKKFANGDFGDANFVIRLEGGIIGVCHSPELGNPIIDANTGKVLYNSICVSASEDYDEYDEYNKIIGVKVV